MEVWESKRKCKSDSLLQMNQKPSALTLNSSGSSERLWLELKGLAKLGLELESFGDHTD